LHNKLDTFKEKKRFMLPQKTFGYMNQQVTVVGLGGEGILRTYGQSDQAPEVIQEALAQGISYFDSGRVYADSEIYYGSVWEKKPETRSMIFQTSKSARRDKAGALADLEQSLQRLHTHYLDLWQIHDVRTEDDLQQIAGPEGALEAFLEARVTGKVRFIGVTGHHDPRILTKAIREWPVDAVMMPVNPVEELLGGFLTSTLPLAKEKGIAIIGMKTLGASHYLIPQLGITAESLIRYALSYQITVVLVGCSTPAEVRILASAGADQKTLSEEAQSDLLEKFKPYAKRLAFYRGVL
jgi:aryl-alcohol dehydrogenase-like predicted oxidoreductase